MKYVVYVRRSIGATIRFKCQNEEELATQIQDLRNMGFYDDSENKVRVYPYFKEGSLVLNVKKGETRIVRRVDFDEETLELYNSDDPEKVTAQKAAYSDEQAESAYEVWDIKDCVVVNLAEAKKEYDFKVGTEMGMSKISEE